MKNKTMPNEQKEQIREEFDKILSQRLERILNGDSKVLILEKEQIFRDIDSLLISQRESLKEEYRKETMDNIHDILWNKDGSLKSYDISTIVSSVMHYFIR